MNKNICDIDKHSVTLSIIHNCTRIELSDNQKLKMQRIINQNIHKQDYKCEIETFRDDAVAFKRATKPHRFSREEAKIIREESGSIRYKAKKYETSTTTIQNIMKDRYFKPEDLL